jgi:hypothetical protein
MDTGLPTMTLHMGSSVYTPDELNGDLHQRRVVFTLTPNDCREMVNNVGVPIVNERDVFCRSTRKFSTKEVMMEVKISRAYLRACGSPDNLLSYTLKPSNKAEVYTPLTEAARAYLKEMGVTQDYTWTYSYAYFGSRPEPVPSEPETETSTTAPEPETESSVTEETESVVSVETETEFSAPITDTSEEEETTRPAPADKGCKSAVPFGVVVMLLLPGAAAVLYKKRN